MKDSHKKSGTNSHSSRGADHSFHGMEADSRALKITGWLTGIYFIIELGLGFYSGSISVISDAFHTFSAVGGILIALIANRIATRKPESGHTFGMQRAEIVGALLNGVFLLLMGFYVLYMGYQRLQNEIEISTGPMFLAAAGGLLIEFISIGLLYKKQKNNLNMKGAFWHVMQTFIGSIIIIVAAIVIKLTGFYAIDPILGMLFGLVLFYVSWGIIKETFDILLEATPKSVDVNEVISNLQNIDGVEEIHHIHAWSLTSGKNLFSGHVKIDEKADHDAVLGKANELLKESFGFYFSTLQVEKSCPDGVEDQAAAIDYDGKK